MWYLHENSQIHYWDRTEIPELDPRTYGQLNFAKVPKKFIKK